jgi:hypothetical protein
MRSLVVWITLAAGACAAAPPPMTLPADFPAAAREAIWSDASLRAGVSGEQLKVVSAQAVSWRDGSLGCPQPGMVYTQALVPGWRLELAVPGAAPLLYHVSRRSGTWVWCPRERAQPPAAGDSGV